MPIEFLMFPGCPLADAMLTNLRTALQRLGRPVAFRPINIEQLPDDDPRRGYGSPTILVDGRDLMSAHPARTGRITCRVYPGYPTGVTAEDIAARLSSMEAGGPAGSPPGAG